MFTLSPHMALSVERQSGRSWSVYRDFLLFFLESGQSGKDGACGAASELLERIENRLEATNRTLRSQQLFVHFLWLLAEMLKIKIKHWERILFAFSALPAQS